MGNDHWNTNVHVELSTDISSYKVWKILLNSAWENANIYDFTIT